MVFVIIWKGKPCVTAKEYCNVWFYSRLLSEILKQPAHWVEDVHTYSISDLVSVSVYLANVCTFVFTFR